MVWYGVVWHMYTWYSRVKSLVLVLFVVVVVSSILCLCPVRPLSVSCSTFVLVLPVPCLCPVRPSSLSSQSFVFVLIVLCPCPTSPLSLSSQSFVFVLFVLCLCVCLSLQRWPCCRGLELSLHDGSHHVESCVATAYHQMKLFVHRDCLA